MDERLKVLPIPDDDDLDGKNSNELPNKSLKRPVTAAEVRHHAAAGDLEAQQILAQVTRRVDGIQASELRDLAANPLTSSEELLLAKVEYWTQALLLEDDQAAFTYQQVGFTTDEVRAVVGTAVWDKLFWDSQNGVPHVVAEDSYLPYQLRLWMAHPMRDIKAKIYSAQELTAQKEQVATALSSQLPKIKKIIKKITKEKKNAETRGKPGHAEVEGDDDAL